MTKQVGAYPFQQLRLAGGRSDVWLNEGHATWYEFKHANKHRYLKQDYGYST